MAQLGVWLFFFFISSHGPRRPLLAEQIEMFVETRTERREEFCCCFLPTSHKKVEEKCK